MLPLFFLKPINLVFQVLCKAFKRLSTFEQHAYRVQVEV